MKRIRDDIYQVTATEMGLPFEKGFYEVPDLGEVFIDLADVRYIESMRGAGYEPTFFVSPSEALHGFVVVSRQHRATP